MRVIRVFPSIEKTGMVIIQAWGIFCHTTQNLWNLDAGEWIEWQA